jgi:hypothetical protein
LTGRSRWCSGCFSQPVCEVNLIRCLSGKLLMCTLLVKETEIGLEPQMTEGERKAASRRQAIKPIIGHLKSDHRLDRCYFEGPNRRRHSCSAVCCRLHIRWLMRLILQKGIKPFLMLFFAQEIRALFENLKQIVARFQTNPVNLRQRVA